MRIKLYGSKLYDNKLTTKCVCRVVYNVNIDDIEEEANCIIINYVDK